MIELDWITDIFDNVFKVGASMGTTLVFAVIAGLIYAAKGKPWFGGACLGFFLGPLGVFIALVSSGSGAKESYQPQQMTLPKMRTATVPSYAPSLPGAQYRLPGRCPHCNAPVHGQELHSPYTTCPYCGSQIEATPVAA